jgi:hypothetical protein
VIEVLEQDHREVEQMFAELESLRGATTEDARSVRPHARPCDRPRQRGLSPAGAAAHSRPAACPR